MPYRISFFWKVQQDQEAGWSENFWNNTSVLATAKAEAAKLVPWLNKLHGDQTICTNIRYSLIGGFRNAVLETRSVSPGGILGTGADSDFCTTGVLLMLKTDTGQIVRQWLRGLSDGQVDSGGRFNPGYGTWASDFAAFVGELGKNSNNWRLRVLDMTKLKLPLESITVAGECKITGHPYVLNDRVRLSGVHTYPQANRIWRVTKTGADTFTLQNWPVPVVTTTQVQHPTAQLQSYVYKEIKDCTVVRATSHQTGRPFGLRIGRRRSRAK